MQINNIIILKDNQFSALKKDKLVKVNLMVKLKEKLNLIIVRNKGNWPLYKASCLNMKQVAVTYYRGTSVVKNLKFLTLFLNS